MSDTYFQGSPEEEERFKYEVIRGLSESVRQLASGMADMQKTQVGMLERLARLEANEFGKALVATNEAVMLLDQRVDALLRDKDRRDGALGMLGTIKTWAPTIFSLFILLYLVGRSTGVIPSSDIEARAKAKTSTMVEQPKGANE